MNLTYNGVTQPSNLITFTDIPNILKVEDTAGGQRAVFSLMFEGNLKQYTLYDGQWYITFLGETITNVIDYNNAVNKNFYCASTPQATAASVARALRNCPTIAANFTIEHSDDEVELKARYVGKMWSGMNNYFSTSISATTCMTYTAYDGSAYSQLNGALINVDLIVDGNYITSLAKNYYGKECAFNMSPLLTTLAKVGETWEYDLDISYTKEGDYTFLGTISNNHIAQGYMVNQGAKYLDLSSNNVIVAQNYSRGTSRDVSNKTILYVYGNSIPVSFYRNNSSPVQIGIIYRNSAFEAIGSDYVTYSDSDTDNKLKEQYISLSNSLLERSFYVDITIGGQTIRYNIIKPVKAAESYQRIYWRNSYGGTSFFDFTGQKSESRDVKVSTYQKNIFDYYDDSKNELDKIYDNDVNYTVTIKSHLFEHNGKYVFNDMMQSPELWVERNGEAYGIILDSVSVEEQDRNDIYQATVRFHYSQKPSLI